MMRAGALASLVAASWPATIAAQTAPITGERPERAGRPPADMDDDAEIVVTGQKQRGAVIGDIAPEVQLGPAEIRSYGVSSVADLLEELAPQASSIRGRGGEQPVVLLNGRRISSFAEIRDLPTEAIARVDILPEEVALKYGYSADQRVVNFVLRPRFRAITGEVADKLATEGGGNSATGTGNLVRIQRDRRFTLALTAQATDALLESERDILSTPPRRPYDLTGNVSGIPSGTPLDPLAASIVGVPSSAANAAPAAGAFLPQPNTTDVSPYRTLVPRSRQFTANAVLNRTVFGNVSATVNGTLGVTDTRAQLGLPGTSLTLPPGSPFSPFAAPVELDRYTDALGPLTQSVEGLTGHLGVTLNRDLAHWRLSLTGTYDYANTRTRTETGVNPGPLQLALDAADPAFNPYGAYSGSLFNRLLDDRARSISNSSGANFVASGPLLKAPAGAITTSIKLGGSASALDSSSTRGGILGSANIERRQGDAQVNLDIPLTSRRENFFAAVGDLSLNGNVAVHQLSDFGTLTTIGYGLHWTPIPAISLIVSATDDDGAPTPQQLGNPQVRTPQVRVFDYATGQTVDVTRIDGGNPLLRPDNRRVTKIGLTLKPIPRTNLSITTDYVRSRIRDAIASFPTATASPEIEAAFPDRFVRDASGQLIQFDSRPVNFQHEDSDTLRIGIDFSKPITSKLQAQFAALRAARLAAREAGTPPSPGPDGGPPPGGPDGARGPGGDGARPGGPGGGGRGGGGGGGGGFGGGGGRLQLALYYTLHLRDTVLIRDGVPLLDLLNGSATGSSGGQSRHEIEAQAGVTRDGLGARISANWQSGTIVRGGGGTTDGDLRFSGLATASLRLFTDLGQLPGVARAHPWLRGARVTLAVTNLFDERQRVRDNTGATPLGYQPDLLDPLGRAVRLSVRKLFF